MNISCIVIDDEPNAVQLLEEYIARTPSLILKGGFYDAVDALDFLRTAGGVDVIFTDINMPLLSGMELAELLPRTQKFVFTTAYSEHALSSFSYYVIDYLLKPVSFRRFSQAVLKIEQSLLAQSRAPAGDSGFIFVKTGKQFVKVVFDDILYISGAKEYINIHTGSGNLLVYKRMKETEALLPPQFIRVHHSYIVNSRCIDKIDPGAVNIGKVSIPVSDSYRERLQVYLEGRLK